jgi:hypothetical protein
MASKAAAFPALISFTNTSSPLLTPIVFLAYLDKGAMK